MQRREFTAALGAALVTGGAGCSTTPPPAIPQITGSFSHADAVAAINAVIAKDTADATLTPDAWPRLYDHGKRTENAVILFHGFTNCPQQFTVLAEQFFKRGCNVYIPRIPRHGQKDRLTEILADLSGQELQDCTQDAYRYARGLGERVSAVGLSLGGSMALWLAQTQAVDLAVPISPFLMPIGIPRGIGTLAMHALYTIPNQYWWWDPRVKQNCLPNYAYPGFPTHGLAQVTFFGDAVFRYDAEKPVAKNCVLVTNANESAVNNSVSRGLMSAWKNQGANYSEVVLSGLGPPRHDIIDPTTFPQGKTLVYPTIERLVLG